MAQYYNIEDPFFGQYLTEAEQDALKTKEAFTMGLSELNKFRGWATDIYKNKMLTQDQSLPADLYEKSRRTLFDLSEKAARRSYAEVRLRQTRPDLEGVGVDDLRWIEAKGLLDQYAKEPLFEDEPFIAQMKRHKKSLIKKHKEMYDRDNYEFMRMMRSGYLKGPATLTQGIEGMRRSKAGLPPEINFYRAYGEMYASGRIPDSRALDFFVNPKAYPEMFRELQRTMADETPPAERPMQETGLVDYILGSGMRLLSGGMGTALGQFRDRVGVEEPGTPMPANIEGPPSLDEFRPEDIIAEYGGMVEKLKRASALKKAADEITTYKVKDPYTLAMDMPGRGYRTVEAIVPEEAAEYAKQRKDLLRSIETRGFLGMNKGSLLRTFLVDTVTGVFSQESTARKDMAAGVIGGLYKMLLPDTDPVKHKGFFNALGLEPEDINTMSEEVRSLRNGMVRRAQAAVDSELARGVTAYQDADERTIDYVNAMIHADGGEFVIENPELVPLLGGLIIGPEFYMAKGAWAVAKPAFKAGSYAKSAAVGKVAARAEGGDWRAQSVMRRIEGASDFKRNAIAKFRKLFVSGSQFDGLRKELNAVSAGYGDDIVNQLMLAEDEAVVMAQKFRELSRQGVMLAKKAMRRSKLPDKNEAREALWDTLSGKMSPGELFDLDPGLFQGFKEIAEADVFSTLRSLMVDAGAARKINRGKVAVMGEKANYLPHEVDFELIQDLLGRIGFGVINKTGATPYSVRPLQNAVDRMRKRANAFMRKKHGPGGKVEDMRDADINEFRETLTGKFIDVEDMPGGKALVDYLIDQAAFSRIGPGRLESAGKANTRYTHTRTALADAFPIKDLERATKAYGDRVGRSVETSMMLKGYREVLEREGLYGEGMHFNQLERFDAQLAKDIARADMQANARERAAIKASESLGRKTEDLTKKSAAYQKVIDGIDEELKTLAAEAEAISQRQAAITDLPRATGFGDETEKMWEALGKPVPETGLDEVIKAEMADAAKGLEAGLAEAVPGAIEEAMKGRRIAAERAGGARVTEAYGKARAAGESVAQAEQRLLDIEAAQARLRRHRGVLEDWGVAVGEARAKAALGESVESEKYGLQMTILDGHANREWLKATGREGAFLSDAGKVVVPRAIAQQIDTLLPLQSANLQRLQSMNKVERELYKISESSPVQMAAQWYKEYIQPLGSLWRLGHTSARGLPFITTNMQGGIGLAYVNNGLRLFNPELSGAASKTAFVAAYGGDDAARSHLWKFSSGQQVSIGEVLDTAQKYGLIRQMEMKYGLDMYGSGTSIAGRLYKGVEHATKKLGLQQAAQFGDDFQKLVTIFNRLEGMDKRNWAKVADVVHKEAGHWLRMTPFEKNTLRNVFGFYSWNRHIIPWTMRMTMEHPERMANLDRISRLIDEQTREEHVFPGIGAPWLQSQASFTLPSWAIPKHLKVPYGGDMQAYWDAPQNTLRALLQDERGMWMQLGGPEVRALTWMFTGKDTRGRKIQGLEPTLPHPGDFASFEDFAEMFEWNLSGAKMAVAQGVKSFLPITDAVQKTVEFYSNVGMNDQAYDLQTRAMIARYWGNLDWLYSIGTWDPSKGPLRLETPFVAGGFMKAYPRDLKQSYYRQRDVRDR